MEKRPGIYISLPTGAEFEFIKGICTDERRPREAAV
jgi:hypothetical protein